MTDDQLDALQFADLIGAARRSVASAPAAAIESVNAALALWRGDAYADLLGGGAVAEALRHAVPGFYGGYGVLMWVWFVAVGIALIRLSRRTVPGG